MFDESRNPENSKHYTQSSPEYSIFSSDMLTTMSVAAFLMILTIFGMVFIADTTFAEFGLTLYEIFWLLGVLVFGGLITIGRKLGLSGITDNDYGIAALGSAICVFAYSWFGGAILTMYEVTLYGEIIFYTSIITVLITLGAMSLVYSTDRNYEYMGTVSGVTFLIGLIFAAVGSFVQQAQTIAFGLFLLGFIFDLVFEVWMVSDGRQTPIANGIGVYVAFAGTFVHIMQFVAEEL